MERVWAVRERDGDEGSHGGGDGALLLARRQPPVHRVNGPHGGRLGCAHGDTGQEAQGTRKLCQLSLRYRRPLLDAEPS